MALGDKCLPNAHHLGEEIKAWADLSSTKRYLSNPFDAGIKLTETELLMSLDDISNRKNDITQGQLRSVKFRLKELAQHMKDGSLGNRFVTSFWQTSKFGKKDPVLGAYLRNLQESNFYYKNHEFFDKHHMMEISKSIEDQAIAEGIISKTGVKFSQAQKKLKKLDQDHKKAIFDYQKNPNIGTDKIYEASLEMQKLVSKTYLKVYDDLLWVVENDLGRVEQEKYKKMSEAEKDEIKKGKHIKLTERELLNLKTKDGRTMKEAPDLFKALKSYKSLMDDLYKRLKNGVNAVIDANLERIESENDTITKDALNGIRKKLMDRMMPKYEENGFFPHYTRDLNVDLMSGLMPLLDELETSNNRYRKNSSERTVTEIISSMNTYLSEHVKGRGGEYQYSKNFLNTVTNYIHDVNRFNYMSHLNKYTMQALTSVEKMYKTGKDISGYSQSIVNYIGDLHTAANGDNNMSPKTAAIMRTLLSFEFISKLGINPRSAARNWFQRLLDYVEWGPVQVSRTNRILRQIGLDDSFIEQDLKSVGLLFEDITAELQESAITVPASSFKTQRLNPKTGEIEFIKETVFDRVANKMSWAAGKSSYLHRKAENSNRKHTFKVAYAQMYDWLDNPRYREKLYKEGAESEKIINQKIRGRARNYAINMVILNHFDYADYAKSKVLRHPVGRFMGQFQHYFFEFLERNIKIGREAKHDIASGNFIPGQDAQGLQKALRMGVSYFLAPAIASAIMGVKFNNLIEHDTATRLQQLSVALTGDEDEVKAAFYGKGPLVATFGGPLLSDLLDLGQQLDLINLDEDSLVTILTGLEKHDTQYNDELTQKIRILNTFLGRAWGRHIPQMKRGRVAWALQEFGLYPTEAARKRGRIAARQKKEKQEQTKKVLTPEIRQALELLNTI